ncbi:MAG: YcjX family protein [Synechococcus sp. SB0662_bin_45]|nr:YcjX family protein [Synechococcus sp. SB0668_bin_13]MYE21132.1 YcjX family protein [Synechococcus sp. SB0662_bin_45]
MGRNGQNQGAPWEAWASRGAAEWRRAGKAVETVIPDLERVIRLGVTGLSRAGKTVFITSLVASLKNSRNMVVLAAAREGRIKAANLEFHPEHTIPRFPFEDHLHTMISQDKPDWPLPTKGLSKLRLSLRIRRKSRDWLAKDWLGRDEETVHLDIIDFPGEWLIDLTMMNKNFTSWSVERLERITFDALDGREKAMTYLKQLKRINIEAKLNESNEDAQSLAKTFTAYLKALKEDGYSRCTPGRFLQPGDLENAAVLTFAPLHSRDQADKGSLYKKFESRFEEYKKQVIQPFFENHLSKIDRQVVLVDVMAAIEAGPGPFEDQRKAMKDILSIFQPGRNLWPTQLFQGHKVEKILFAATKADHLHHSQHSRLSTYPGGVLRESVQRADDKGAKTRVMSIAALRVTKEHTVTQDSVNYEGVCGWLAGKDDGRQRWFEYPGTLPDIGALLKEARQGEKEWRHGPQSFPKFQPEPQSREQPLPHIRLDQALEFLIGDLL